MRMYIGEYWVPFPASEYGGTWCVIAEDEEQCIEILKENDSYNEEYFSEIPKSVSEAKVFDLDENVHQTSKIVQLFFT